jgi:hypothetical protein
LTCYGLIVGISAKKIRATLLDDKVKKQVVQAKSVLLSGAQGF